MRQVFQQAPHTLDAAGTMEDALEQEQIEEVCSKVGTSQMILNKFNMKNALSNTPPIRTLCLSLVGSFDGR